MAELKKQFESLVKRAVITDDLNKAIPIYYQSKFNQRCVKKYPEWDVARNGPEAELIKVQRDLLQAEDELEAKLNTYPDKRQDMNNRWNEVEEKVKKFQESYNEFNKFVQENRDKRERAKRKITEEKKRQKQYQDEIQVLEEKLKNMTEIRDKMQHYVKEYRGAQDYLETVVKEIQEFQSIGDIFNRYESLLEARRTLSEQQDKNLQILEDTGIEMQKLTEEKSQKLMSLNNQLATLQSRYERAKTEALKWESIVSRIKSSSAKKNLELTQIKSCCWNIYQQICIRKGVPIEIHQNDIENQLIQIKRTILVLKKIAKSANDKAIQYENTNEQFY